MNDPNHDLWLKKFNKTKEGKMMNLKYDHQALKLNTHKPQPFDSNWVANALYIATKGTKMEVDAKYFIELADPDFFKEPK